jgi:hypothetical protein
LPTFHLMAINSAASHHALSSALQGQHDSSIPMQLPLLFGFLGSFICGVLNFGEALTFMLLWNFARYMSWLGSDVTFAKGVVYSQVSARTIQKVASMRCCCAILSPCFVFAQSRPDYLARRRLLFNSCPSGSQHFFSHSSDCCGLEGACARAGLQHHLDDCCEPCA